MKTHKPRKKCKKRTMRGGDMSKNLSRPNEITVMDNSQIKKLQHDTIKYIKLKEKIECPSGHWWKTNARCVEDNFRITAALIIVHLFESQATAVGGVAATRSSFGSSVGLEHTCLGGVLGRVRLPGSFAAAATFCWSGVYLVCRLGSFQ